MKICKEHWEMIRTSIDEHRMSHLGAKSTEEAVDKIQKELSAGYTLGPKDFDPLMSHHWHWTNAALAAGGLYLFGPDPSGKNEEQYCPICEFMKHKQDFGDPKEAIDKVSKQMQEWAIKHGLVPPVS